MNFKVLPSSFYEPSAKIVAKRLLGHFLLRRTKTGFAGGPIVETEAYLTDDPASHGFSGQTMRNRAMYGPPGRAYVYYIYGAHFCVNAVCKEEGKAEAVLIRAVEAEFDLEFMRANRSAANSLLLTNGPGKLCAALNITRELDGVDLCAETSPLIVAENPLLPSFRKKRGPILATLRIGITKAAHLPLRFCLMKSPFISRRVREPALPATVPPGLPRRERQGR
jgi:DNA-3-methyladenine glycosylase